MKAVLFLSILALFAGSVQAQNVISWKVQNEKTIYSAKWDSVFITGKDYQPSWLIMTHDSGAADIWISWQGDSAKYGRKVALKYFPITIPMNYAKWFKVKADSGQVRSSWWIF